MVGSSASSVHCAPVASDLIGTPVPPIRRRPVPTPPAGGRPKVAGLRRSGSASVEPEEQVTPVVSEPVEDAVPASAPVEPEVVAEPVDEPVVVDAARPLWLLPVALFLVAVLLGGLGFFFQWKAGKSSYDAALVDASLTSEVNGQVREGVEKAFSYNFADVAATEKAANELLAGKAKCQYNAVFGPVKTLAPQQKLVVTVKVVASAVSSLKGDRATVLVFVDQVTLRTTDNQSSGGTAMLRVGAARVDSRWKIDNMEMFGQTPEQAQQMAQCS